MSSNANRHRGDAKSTVFLLTKPPNSERAKLCIQLVERSKNSVLYLVGDGVFNLLNPSFKALPSGSIYACKEDMDARGVQPEDTAISVVEFYEQLVEDMMLRSDKVYAFQDLQHSSFENLAEVFSRCEKVPVLSIIACRILEDELTHVLSLDHTLRHLFLVDNLDGIGLSRKLRAQNRAHLLVAREEIPDRIKDLQKGNFDKIMKPLLNRFHFIRGRASESASEQEFVVVVNVLKMALHSDGKLLKDEVYKNIREMSRFSNKILLFYGSCGNFQGDIGNDLKDLSCPIYFLTDEDDKRVDDCIAVALGGNKRYEETLSRFPSVGIFFTPMWAFNWREIDKDVSKASNSQSLGSMLNSLGYRKVAKLDTGSSISAILRSSRKLVNLQAHVAWKSLVSREAHRSRTGAIRRLKLYR